MIRFFYIIVVSIPLIIYYLWKCNYVVKHFENYTEEDRYSIARRMVNLIKKKGHISTDVYGIDNLPKEGGYVMYPNHQGKYDALGVIYAHDEPLTFVIDEKKSKVILTNEFTKLLEGSRLDKTDIKSQVKTILEITEKVKSGKRVLIFPEGSYENNGNTVLDFKAGAFKCSVKSQTPIVPVALIDSYKAFGTNSIGKVKTQVHFLEPIYFQDYKDLSTSQIAELVRSRIIIAIEKATSDAQVTNDADTTSSMKRFLAKTSRIHSSENVKNDVAS